jgi:hypothetical protein
LLESEEYKNRVNPPDLTDQPGDDLGDEVQLQLIQPIYDALNGSGIMTFYVFSNHFQEIG